MPAALPLLFVARPTLRRGMSGPEVLRLQRLLVARGFLTADQLATGPGVFGPRTELALKAFQNSRALPGTGVAGPETHAALRRDESTARSAFALPQVEPGRFDGSTPAGPTIRPDAWEPVNAPVRSTAGLRSRARYDEVIDQFAVTQNSRYVGPLAAAVFAWDVTRAMGAEVPAWRGDQALDQRQWLELDGAVRGWRETTAVQAQAWANRGAPALAVVARMRSVPPDGQVSPIGVVRPGNLGSRGPTLALAGPRGFNLGQAGDGLDLRAAAYWVHE